MSFKHGSKAAVWYGAYNMSPYLSSAELGVEQETSDVTTFENVGWRSHIPGLLGGGYEFEGFHDPAADVIIQAALNSGSNVLTVCPAGAIAVGDLARLVPVITSAYGQSSPHDDAIAISWGVTADDAIAFGNVLHTLSEDTNTTTGSAIDQGAATSTGWTGHLHVTLVDGGSWVITIEDSANGSSGWATIATFAAATAAGSERLLSAAATTTVRRYLRVVATRTGGSAGQGITYGLAFARQNV